MYRPSTATDHLPPDERRAKCISPWGHTCIFPYLKGSVKVFGPQINTSCQMMPRLREWHKLSPGMSTQDCQIYCWLRPGGVYASFLFCQVVHFGPLQHPLLSRPRQLPLPRSQIDRTCGRITRLPSMTWNNGYTMRSCVHHSTLMEFSKIAPLRFHRLYRRFLRICVRSDGRICGQ